MFIIIAIYCTGCDELDIDIPTDGDNIVLWVCYATVTFPAETVEDCSDCYGGKPDKACCHADMLQFERVIEYSGTIGFCGNDDLSPSDIEEVKEGCEYALKKAISGEGIYIAMKFEDGEWAPFGTHPGNVKITSGCPEFLKIGGVCKQSNVSIDMHEPNPVHFPYCIDDGGGGGLQSLGLYLVQTPYSARADAANSTFNLYLPYVGNVSQNPTGVSIGYEWNCDDLDCEMAIIAFDGALPDFSIDDAGVHDIRLHLNGATKTNYNPDTGYFSYPIGSLHLASQFFVTADDIGWGSLAFTNVEEVVGVLNHLTGEFFLQGIFESNAKVDGNPYELVLDLTGNYFETPPTSVVEGASVYECEGNGLSQINLSGANSTPGKPGADIEHVWGLNYPPWNDTVVLSYDETVSTLLGLGSHFRYHTVLRNLGNIYNISENEITVRDTLSPSISPMPSNDVLECGVDSYVEQGAFAIDICDPNVSTTVGGEIVDSTTAGLYTVQYTATDQSGNSSTAYRTVEVQDTQPPVITSTPVSKYTCVPAPLEVAIPLPVVTDDCGSTPELTSGKLVRVNGVDVIPAIDINLASPSLTLPVGVSEIEWQASDSQGNTSSTTQTIDVILSDDAAECCAPG